MSDLSISFVTADHLLLTVIISTISSNLADRLGIIQNLLKINLSFHLEFLKA